MVKWKGKQKPSGWWREEGELFGQKRQTGKRTDGRGERCMTRRRQEKKERRTGEMFNKLKMDKISGVNENVMIPCLWYVHSLC